MLSAATAHMVNVNVLRTNEFSTNSSTALITIQAANSFMVTVNRFKAMSAPNATDNRSAMNTIRRAVTGRINLVEFLRSFLTREGIS